jgi:hypothetical protein
MKIGLISYNYIHLKTEQVFEGLIRKGFDLKFYLLPFQKRENLERVVLFNHRPNQINSIAVEEIAKAHNISIDYLNDIRGGSPPLT